MLGVLLAAGIAGYAAKKITSTVETYVEHNSQNKIRELTIMERKMAYSEVRRQYICAACSAPIVVKTDNPYGNLVCEYCGSVLTKV